MLRILEESAATESSTLPMKPPLARVYQSSTVGEPDDRPPGFAPGGRSRVSTRIGANWLFACGHCERLSNPCTQGLAGKIANFPRTPQAVAASRRSATESSRFVLQRSVFGRER